MRFCLPRLVTDQMSSIRIFGSIHIIVWDWLRKFLCRDLVIQWLPSPLKRGLPASAGFPVFRFPLGCRGNWDQLLRHQFWIYRKLPLPFGFPVWFCASGLQKRENVGWCFAYCIGLATALWSPLVEVSAVFLVAWYQTTPVSASGFHLQTFLFCNFWKHRTLF